MPNEERLMGAVGKASLMAGPLFLGLVMMLEFQKSARHPLPVGWADIPQIASGTALAIPLTMLVGACLAFPVCLVMGGILLLLANRAPLLRPAVLWIAVGAGAALGVTQALFGTISDTGALAFAATAMACAALVRSHFRWD